MAYDETTYGASPFGQPASAAPRPARTPPVKKRRDSQETAADSEALSDQLSDPLEAAPPDLPTEYAPVLPPTNGRSISFFYLPRGRVAGLTLLGEAFGWLMAWGTVGFFRAYIPPPVTLIFDRGFTPWGMAGTTFISALLIGQLLKRHQLKVAALRTLATTAIEYGETHHRADAQIHIDELLIELEDQSEQTSRWIVSWLTALGCLFIIGAFY